MKNIVVIIVFALITAASAALLLSPPDETSVKSENRALATMIPLDEETVFSGKFAEGFENYLTDNIGFRSYFTGFSEWLNSVKGVESPAGKIIYAGNDMGTGVAQSSSILVADNTIYEIFADNDSEQEYIDALNHYAETLDKNITLYSMLIPTQLEFSEPIYANLQDSQKETIDYIYSNLDSRITAVNAYDELAAHKDEYIYFHTDHHWTPRGAYYGYRAFAEASENSPVSMDRFESYKIKNFLGYLYSFAQSPELKNHPDTIEWYDVNENNTITASMRGFDDNNSPVSYGGNLFETEETNYDIFLGGDHPFVLIENSANPLGKTLIILKDSYANSFVPWVINNYRRVIMIDPRMYSISIESVIDEFEPDEMLIMNYVFTPTFRGYCDSLIGLY